MRTQKWFWALLPLTLLIALYAAWSIWSTRQESMQMHEVAFGTSIGNPWYKVLPSQYGVFHTEGVLAKDHSEFSITKVSNGDHWRCIVKGKLLNEKISENGEFAAILHEVGFNTEHRQVYCSLFERPGRLCGYFKVPDNPDWEHGFGYVYPSLDGHAVLYQRYDKRLPGSLRQALFVR